MCFTSKRHTPTVTRRVLQRHDGRVVEIDTGMLKSSYRGVGSALVIEGNSLLVVREEGTEKTAVIPHPRRVGARADALSASVLEQFLADADIVSVSGEQPDRKTDEITEKMRIRVRRPPRGMHELYSRLVRESFLGPPRAGILPAGVRGAGKDSCRRGAR